MVTVGSLNYRIVADVSQFTQGMLATKRELRAAEAAFISSRTPAEKLGLEVSELSNLFSRGALSALNYQRALETQSKSQGLTGQIAAMEQAQRETREMAAAMKAASAESGKFSMAEQAKVTQLNRTSDALGKQANALRERQAADARQAEADSRALVRTQRVAQAEALRQQIMQRGSQLTRSMESDTERYAREMQELGMLLRRGAIDQQTYNRAASQSVSRRDAQANIAAERERQQLMSRGASLIRNVESATDSYQREVRELNQLLRAGAIDQGTYNRAIKQTRQSLKEARTSTKGMNASGSEFMATTKGMMKGALTFGAIYGTINQVGSGFSIAQDLETTRMSFEVLTGSAENAAKLVDQLRQYDLQTTFNFSDTSAAAQKLMNFGVQAEDVIGNLRALGDISMGDAEKLSRLSLAFGQTTSMGRLMGNEVRQMVEAGFNPLQEISRTTGESMGALQKRMEDGGISSKELADAIASATAEGGRFFGMVDKRAQSTAGQIDLLRGEWDMLKADLATTALPAVSGGVSAARELLGNYQGKKGGIQTYLEGILNADSTMGNFFRGSLGYNLPDVIGNKPSQQYKPGELEAMQEQAALAAKEKESMQVAIASAKAIADPITNAFSGIEALFKKQPAEHEEDKRHREAMASRNAVIAKLQGLIETQPVAVE